MRRGDLARRPCVDLIFGAKVLCPVLTRVAAVAAGIERERPEAGRSRKQTTCQERSRRTPGLSPDSGGETDGPRGEGKTTAWTDGATACERPVGPLRVCWPQSPQSPSASRTPLLLLQPQATHLPIPLSPAPTSPSPPNPPPLCSGPIGQQLKEHRPDQ